MNFTVLLKDQTVGKLDADVEPATGEMVTVTVQDENGNKFAKTGEVTEILESSDY